MPKSRGILIRGNDEARFDSHVAEGPTPPGMSDPCWLWTGARQPSGYAQFQVGGRLNKRHVGVHRWNYERFVAEVPEGYEVDHLCRVRHCVNPWHLEAVPGRVNNARSDSPSAINARRVLCTRGLHELAGDNVLSPPSFKGGRACRACRNENQRRRRAAQRQEKAA